MTPTQFMFFVMSSGQNDPLYQKTLAMAIDRRVHQRARFSDWIYGNTTVDVPIPYPLPADDPSEAGRLAEANRTFALPVLREPLVDLLVDRLMTSHPPHAIYQHNITGFLKGDWTPLNVTLPPEPVQLNATDTTEPLPFAPRWKSQRGNMPWLHDGAESRKVSLNLRETKDSQVDPGVAVLRGNLEFEIDGRSARQDVEGIQCVSALLFGPRHDDEQHGRDWSHLRESWTSSRELSLTDRASSSPRLRRSSSTFAPCPRCCQRPRTRIGRRSPCSTSSM